MRQIFDGNTLLAFLDSSAPKGLLYIRIIQSREGDLVFLERYLENEYLFAFQHPRQRRPDRATVIHTKEGDYRSDPYNQPVANRSTDDYK